MTIIDARRDRAARVIVPASRPSMRMAVARAPAALARAVNRANCAHYGRRAASREIGIERPRVDRQDVEGAEVGEPMDQPVSDLAVCAGDQDHGLACHLSQQRSTGEYPLATDARGCAWRCRTGVPTTGSSPVEHKIREFLAVCRIVRAMHDS
jgi:hypothetical protein